MQPAMFFGPGQQQGFMPPQPAGRAGMPFAPQQGMVVPGLPGTRQGQFPAIPSQQGGRGAPNGMQQMPPNAFGMAGQMPFSAMPQAGPGAFPGGAFAYNQAMAQVQAFAGRGGPGGRGQIQGMQGMAGMQGMQGNPQQMLINQGMRGRDGRPQYPGQPGRGGPGVNMQPGQMGGFPQQGRGSMGPSMIPPTLMAQNMPMAGMGGVPNLEMIMAAPPGQQKQLLGESLYPKIQLIHPKLAGKITGMLLEMDSNELFGL